FRARHRGSARAETAYELTWRYRLNPHLALQPDLQYIVHPALGAAGNARAGDRPADRWQLFERPLVVDG
ncbi:carbohydrate porin, partial [Rhodanobacter sp. 115]|uniref:carbohydrate porin n=1 Tax=Rhodanobacter sp. FW021-MT20 TaxID=1162282 RepID=UPI000260DF2D